MRKLITGLVAGLILGTTGVGIAATQASHDKAYTLLAGQAVTFGGMTCTAYKGTTATNSNIVCVKNNLKGYGVVVSQDQIVIAKRVNGEIKIIWKKANS